MNKKKMHQSNNVSKPRRALLVGIALGRITEEETSANLQELESLAKTNNIKSIGRLIQKREKFSVKTKIGKGKVEELAEIIKSQQIDEVIFDDPLSPAQIRNLEKAIDCRVKDRNLLILEIFAKNARTTQAKTQVLLAKYEYLLPRLTRMWTHLSRQRGNAGMQGTGEKELETDKRLIKEKIKLLKREMIRITKRLELQRGKRKNFLNVALVGYTNAGKSTLMSALSDSQPLIEDKLFATLTTLVRKVVWNKMPLLLVDTIGFIRKIPHNLIACFQVTLQEVREADLLLHVVDYSHPQARQQIEVVQNTLSDLEAEKIPTILLLNKIDKIKNSSQEKINWKEEEKKIGAEYNMPALAISAHNGGGLGRLADLAHQMLYPIYINRYPQKNSPPKAP